MKLLEFFSKYQKLIIFGCLLIAALSFIDKALGVGTMFVFFLASVSFFLIGRCKEEKQRRVLGALFLVVLSLHVLGVLFIYYTHFQPFSGGFGDYSEYNLISRDIAQRVQQGNFSLQGIEYGHFYPVIIGYIYALTLPEPLIGQMFNAWLVALLVIFVYLMVLEMGGSEKEGFFAGLVVSVYPSLLFFGSLLLKDALAALLCLIVLLLILKLLNVFSWSKFLIFYVFLGLLIHLRIYIGFAALLTFAICWFIFSNLKIRKRFVYGAIFIFLLGFLPNISGGEGVGAGYYGINFMKVFLNPSVITQYREIISVPNPEISPITGLPVYNEPSASADNPVIKRGRGSAVTVETGFENPFTFLKNSLISFIYVSLGPFPWQMRYLRHLFVLPELILWYFALFFMIKGIRKPIRSHTFTLLIFSIIVFCALSLYLCNFGITTRIRIPALISLFCLAPFGINWASKNRIIKTFSRSLDVLMKI